MQSINNEIQMVAKVRKYKKNDLCGVIQLFMPNGQCM